MSIPFFRALRGNVSGTGRKHLPSGRGEVSMKEKKRIVIKVGTSTLTHESGALNLQRIEHMARVLADLHGMGHEVILVSSGAIAVGVAELQMEKRPTELRYKQAAAAVGQCNIMHIYDKFFSEYTCSVAQILLTGDDVDDSLRAEHPTGCSGE